MASTSSPGAEDVGGGLRVPRGEGRAGEPVAVAEPDEGGDRELVAARVGEHGDRVADFEVLAIGGRLVDRHLVGAGRCRPLALDLQPGEPVRAGPRDAERRRALGGDGLAVRVDELGVAEERGLDGRDSVDGGDLVGE